MIPDGRHPAVVVPIRTPEGEVYCQFGESEKKRTPLVRVSFEILRGPAAGERIRWDGYFPPGSDDVVDRTIAALRACGFTGDNLGDFPGQVVDQEVSLVIEAEEYNGKSYPKVQWVNPVGGGQALKVENAMDPKALRLFSSRLQSRVKASAPISGPKAVREPASGQSDGSNGIGETSDDQTPPTGSVDDIPF